MSKEVMKLALEALENAEDQLAKPYSTGARYAITALREALAEQPAQHRAWFTVDELNAWADKKLKENPQWAEQPAQHDPSVGTQVNKVWWDGEKLVAKQFPLGDFYKPAQQGQVAWTLLLTGENHGLIGKAGEKFVGHPEHYERVDVYTSLPAQRKPLTDEQQIAEALRVHGLTLMKTASGYEVLKLGQIAAHGIKENT